MSHVDEGLLHAFLDGALDGSGEHADVVRHLDGCADCRARMEEARALRQRVAGLLEGAPAGDIVAPPFAEVLARSGHRPKRAAVFTMNRLVGLGWAATLALAVGVGWLARGSLPIGRDAAQLPLAARPAERRAEPETAQEAAAETVASEEQDAAAGGRGGLGESRQEAETVPMAATPPAEPTVVAGLAHDAVTDEPAAAKAGAPAPARADDAPGVMQVAAEAPSAPQLRAEAAARGRTAVNETEARDMVEGGAWQLSNAESASAYLSTPVLAVPGLDLLRIETGAVLGALAVRVTQRLDGDSVVIVQYRTSDAEGLAAGVDAAGAGYPVALRRPGITALLRGSVPADSLRRLAERIP